MEFKILKKREKWKTICFHDFKPLEYKELRDNRSADRKYALERKGNWEMKEI
jgi:hypothetical protein